jgi:hypothetical protein
MVFVLLSVACIYRRLYTVGPSSPEGTELNMRGGGFLLSGLHHCFDYFFIFCNLGLSMLVFLRGLYCI